MTSNRPVNLSLTQFKFPIAAIVSILHRISGVLLFLALPVLLYTLSHSLQSDDAFAQVVQYMRSPVALFFAWVILSATLFHLLAGIRHLMMDLGLGEGLKAGQFTAISVIVLTAIGAILMGVWLW